MTSGKNDIAANPGYLIGLIRQAAEASARLSGTADRVGAEARIQRLEAALRGLVDHSVQVGSRTPVQSTPAWATLDVVRGGFATGAPLAEGPLQEHEVLQLSAIGAAPGAGRAALNAHSLSEAGLGSLQRMADTGCFRVNVPEEAALLVTAWLIQHGEAAGAADLLEAISTFLNRLRFYPVPDAVPMSSTSTVHVEAAQATAARFRNLRTKEDVLTMNETLAVWNPIFDGMVALLLETVEGAPPRLQLDAAGKPCSAPSGALVVDGGWPGVRFPDGWTARARALLSDFAVARQKHKRAKWPDKPKENFAALRLALDACASNPTAVTRRDWGRVRRILASTAHKRGEPGSVALNGLRARQAAWAVLPLRTQLGATMAARLEGYAPGEGIGSVDALMVPLSADESAITGAPAGSKMPGGFAAFPETTAPSAEFAALCNELTGMQGGRLGWSIASNGQLIERQQIVTTQNLAVLFEAMDLRNRLGIRLESMARDCLSWILRRFRQKDVRHHAALIRVKNAAYAWRQMVFYLALLPADVAARFFAWAGQELAKQPADSRGRFAPALEGLVAAAEGEGPSQHRPFTGWSTERHWLIG